MHTSILTPATQSPRRDSETPPRRASEVEEMCITNRVASAFAILSLLDADPEIDSLDTNEAKQCLTGGTWENVLHLGGKHLNKFRWMVNKDRSVLEKRDAVGASPLHKMLLYNTESHLQLAKVWLSCSCVLASWIGRGLMHQRVSMFSSVISCLWLLN